MITMITQGGLGNQMFQYAAGLAQAYRLGTELQLETSRNGLSTFRPFNLELFDTDVKTTTDQKPATFLEEGLTYHPEIRNVQDGEVLVGYFQSEKYFEDIKSIVLRKLSPMVSSAKRPWSRAAMEFMGQILAAGQRATYIGFRRTDYLRGAQLRFHGVMPDEYYTEALGVVASNLGEPPVLFAFSDEPDWVEDNIEFPYETHIFKGDRTVPDHIGREDIDLALMSRCHNAIIANSSFHWWGAWLGDRSRVNSGTVVAPATWFVDAAAQSQTGDLIPERWTRV